MAEICPAWSSAKVQSGGLYFMSWTFGFWIFLQNLSLDALKNKESGKTHSYLVKQTVVLFIGLKSKTSMKHLTLLQVHFSSQEKMELDLWRGVARR